MELDVTETCVCLVIPSQVIAGNDPGAGELPYGLTVNDVSGDVQIPVCTRGGSVTADELRHPLDTRLGEYEVSYPDELGGQKYEYRHHSSDFYTFVAVGGDRGRLHRFDPTAGAAGALPQRMMWLLLRNGIEPVEPQPFDAGCWMWNDYKLWRVDLRNTENLKLKYPDGQEKLLPCRVCPRLEGPPVVDDFVDTEPLFAGCELKVVWPVATDCQQVVWLRGRAGVPKKLSWDSGQPLRLELPQDLPCECGHFQLDICRADGEVDAVLFFRFLPGLQLEYPSRLILPDVERGHGIETVRLRLDSGWEVKEGERALEVGSDGWWCIQVGPEQDRVCLVVAKPEQPETATEVQVKIPRLKWRLGHSGSWGGRVLTIPHRDLVSGEPMVLLVRTNDLRNAYRLTAELLVSGKQEQSAPLNQVGSDCRLEVNCFFDTIRSVGTADLGLVVRDAEGERVGEVGILHFAAPARAQVPVVQQVPTRALPVARIKRGTSPARAARGFSFSELRRAGLNPKAARGAGIRVDPRRRTAHDWNVKVLRSQEHRRGAGYAQRPATAC